MRLSALLAGLPVRSLHGDGEVEIRRVVQDSREVDATCLFVALRGARVDARALVPTLSPAAVLSDGPVQARPGVPVVQVEDARAALAAIAARLEGEPSHHLPVLGVTGTNGKTTTTWMVEAIARHAGWKVGRIGTTGASIDGEALPLAYTTPPAPALQALLRQMRERGCRLCAMEVSSIGLAQRRVDAMRFRGAAFTSFSQDHLDVHGDMESYLRAKLRLFEELLADDARVLVHGADPVAPRVIHAAGAHPVWTYGRGEGFDLRALEVESDLAGSRARLVVPTGEAHLHLRIPGPHNIDNALAAIGLALHTGIDLATAVEGLAALEGVPGRMQLVADPHGARTVVVDYAHSPDALERALSTLRALRPRRLLVVFGCGGDRDAEKRPLMGEIAARLADEVVLTSDNPRHEDPLRILAEIEAGVPRGARPRVRTEADRARAIRSTIAALRPGEALLIAGKGHERTQTVGDQTFPFDDREQAAQALAEERP